MLVNKKDRDRLRKLQDKIVYKAEKKGFVDDDKIGLYYNGNSLILKDLKNYIWPTFESQLREIIE